jgi:hypothetical protein
LAREIEVGEALRPGDGRDLERSGAAGGQAVLGLLAAGRGDQGAQGRAGRGGRAGDGGPGFVDLQDRALERVDPVDQGRAEGRGDGEVVELGGGVVRAGRRHGLGRRRPLDRRQAQQEPLAREHRALDPALDPADLAHLAGPAVALGRAQQGVGAAQGVVGEAPLGTEEIAPRLVGAFHPAVGGDDRGRFGQGDDEVAEVRLGLFGPGCAAKGDESDQGQGGQARQQQQSGPGRGPGPERRGGGQDHR